MPEYKPFLPPHIGKWLASDKPELLAKAEVALRAAEPDANHLLQQRLRGERDYFTAYSLLGFLSLHFVWQIVNPVLHRLYPLPHGTASDFFYALISISIALPFAIPLMFFCLRRFALPAGARYAAILLKLAQRGDVWAVPVLLGCWLEPSPVGSARLPDIEDALIVLTKNAAPGSIPLSDKANSKDPAANLRGKVARMTRKQNGVVFFAPSATQNPRRIQVWLALLPHLATDPNPKSQAVLAGLLDAQARTLEEELLQNTVRSLLTPSTGTEPADGSTEMSAPSETWKPTETNEMPTLLQRLGRQ